MKKTILLAVSALLLIPAGLRAQSELDPYRSSLDVMLNDMGDDRKVDIYCFADVDRDGHDDLVLASYDRKRVTVYSVAGEGAAPRQIPLTAAMVKEIQSPEVYFTSIDYLYSLPEDDHLRRLAPLFVWDVDYANNRFSFATGEDDSYLGDVTQYTNMVFKPHVGKVSYAGKVSSPKEYYDYDLVWKLDDPEFVKTGFRGYKEGEVSPVLFKDGFEDTINILNFSRWKRGEAVRSVSQDVKDAISFYYRGEKMAGIRYVADCAANERSWYRVVFSRKGDMSHTALVCVAEGEVVSVWDNYMDLSDFGASPSDVWYGGSLQEFWDYKQVEFMAMWGSPAGLEIAVRWASMEGIHYSILREYGNKMLIVYDDYQYIMAY